ncbi:hypothetical protein [Chthonobacter albigriseus]|nr:hypothetical protein [Chthonobacter albigriseus]
MPRFRRLPCRLIPRARIAVAEILETMTLAGMATAEDPEALVAVEA